MNKNIILVDKNNKQIAEDSVISCHLEDAKRHRAITAFLKNSKGQYLMTKRSLKKPLWPTYWDAAFSTHPRVGETVEDCCTRRITEELGISIIANPVGAIHELPLQPMSNPFSDTFSYEYHIRWNIVFSEWEINHILVAQVPDNIDLSNINPEEASDYKWMTWSEITEWVKEEKDNISPWLVVAVEKINQDKKLNKIFK